MSAVPIFAQEEGLIRIGDPPENHVWDRDNLFRNDKEALAEISKTLTDLEVESNLEIYLVTHSAVIGEKPNSLSMRCHEEWLGEENDGLVFVLSFNGDASVVVGRSRKLYEGQFLDQGKLPRVGFSNLQTIMTNTIAKLGAEEDPIARVTVFTRSIAASLKERIAGIEEAKSSKQSSHFMGWMALALLGCGIVIGLLSKLMGEVEHRAKKRYHFPDFVVAQRLKASNGGGKVSVVSFGSPPSSAEQ